MTQPPQFTIRDTYGNVYGPASIDLLRQWIREGRIVRGMSIAPENSTDWSEVPAHPALADLFLLKPTPSLAIPLQSASTQPPITAHIELAYKPPTERIHPLAITSLIAGILSFCSCACCCIPFFAFGVAGISSLCSITAIITGIFGLHQIRTQQDYVGKSYAVVGIILGSLYLLIVFGLFAAGLITIFNSK